MKKNVAGQVVGAQLVSATDGSNFTGTAVVYVTGDGGTQGAGAGTVQHEGNGYHSYFPTQAETNYDHIAFTFTGTGAVSSTSQIYTTFPQSADVSGVPAAVWASGTRTLTAGTNIVLAKGTGITGFNDITSASVWAVGTRELTSGANIVLAKGTGVTGFNDLSAAQVNAECDTAIADVGLTTTITGRIDTAVSSRLAGASYTSPDNAGIASIKGVTDKLDTAMVLDGSVYQFTANALELAPTGGGGGLTAEQVWTYATRTLTSGANIALAKGIGVTGFNDLSTAQVKTQADSALSDVGLTTTITGRIDTAISTRMATFSYVAPDNVSITAIKERTDRLPDAPANQDTSLSIEGTVESISDNVDAPVSSRLASADYTAPNNSGVADIKAKTDQLAFYSGSLNSNIKYVNDVEVKGNGSPGNEWGP